MEVSGERIHGALRSAMLLGAAFGDVFFDRVEGVDVEKLKELVDLMVEDLEEGR
jgi:hypothetical protein